MQLTLILIHTSTTSLSDDRTKGNTLPIEDGKILVTVRQWSSNSIDPPTDEAVADFLRFLDKYVSLNYGHRALAKYFKLNRDKSLVDKITTEDIAISILIYENSVDVWEEDQRKKEDPNFHPTPAAVPKYHVKKGVHVLFVLQMDGQTKAVHTTRVYVLKSNVSRALNSFGRVSRNIGRPTPRHTTGHTVNICTALLCITSKTACLAWNLAYVRA